MKGKSEVASPMSQVIIHGDALLVLRTLPDESVQCCITSPPYWGLRDYGIAPIIWDAIEGCEHEWGNELKTTNSGGGWADPEKRDNYPTMRLRDPAKEKTNDVSQGNFCSLCGAWRGSYGLEPTPELYVKHTVQIFRECRRVLRDDGTLWLNIGDSYAGSGRGRDAEGTWNPGQGGSKQATNKGAIIGRNVNAKSLSKNAIEEGAIGNAWVKPPLGFKPKDLVGIPWMLAFALRNDGWYLRQDIIWHKPNPMPESVTDRCTKAHEYIFLFSKNRKYYYDADAIREPASYNTNARVSRAMMEHKSAPTGERNGIRAKKWKTSDGWDTTSGEGGHGNFHKEGREKGQRGYKTKSQENGQSPQHHGSEIRPKTVAPGQGIKNNHSFDEALVQVVDNRNKRSVWAVPTMPYKGAHFATFPEALITPCVLAGAPEGGIVLDPFAGSGTTLAVAKAHNRKYIGIELNPEYIKLAEKRLAKVPENLFA